MWTSGLTDQQYRSIPSYSDANFITPEIVNAILPELTLKRSGQLAAAFNECCPKYNLDRPVVFHEFIATCAEESQSFSVFEEKLSYSSARMIQVWASRFKKIADAKPYEHQPQKLANFVYANRNGNGATATGDGWKYRGGGAIQLTGADMYRKYAEYVNKTIDEVVSLVRTEITWAIDSACWVFAIEKSLLDEAEKDLFELITKRVNGGLTNYATRKRIYERAMKYFPIVKEAIS